MILDSSGALATTIVVLALYFIPAIIAFLRHHHNAVAILVTNVLLGWTLIGWVAALIWSLTRPAPAVNA